MTYGKVVEMSTSTSPAARGRSHDAYAALLKRCADIKPVLTAVAYPCERTALIGVVEAAQQKLIEPILVGPRNKILEIARQAELDIEGFRIEDVEDPAGSAAKAVELVRKGEAEVLMKGSLHTDELMAAVVPSATGLRTGRRISHAFVMS